MSGRLFYLNIQNKLSQLLNPALCLTCGITVRSDEFICPHCLISLHLVPNPCSLCGLTNQAPSQSETSICPACRHNPPRWQRMIAPLIYQGNTRKLIHEFKFSEQIHHANALLTHLYRCYSSHPVEALIPVPLHKTRLLERGFNQAEEIAKILSQKLNIPVDRNSLHRIKETESQSGLSFNKRQKNILKAFEFKAGKQYHSIALVDDIITSGSTMSEICKVLKNSGIRHIQVWSLARVLKHD